MIYCIDRIENGTVTAEETETGEMKNFSLSLFPPEVYEGMVFSFENNVFTHLSEEERRRSEEILALQDELFGTGNN